QAFEFAMRLVGDDLRERSLAGTRRPVKNQRLNAICFNRAPQELARSEDVRLAYVFRKNARAHPSSERRMRSDRSRRQSRSFLGRLDRFAKKIFTRHNFT